MVIDYFLLLYALFVYIHARWSKDGGTDFEANVEIKGNVLRQIRIIYIFFKKRTSN